MAGLTSVILLNFRYSVRSDTSSYTTPGMWSRSLLCLRSSTCRLTQLRSSSGEGGGGRGRGGGGRREKEGGGEEGEREDGKERGRKERGRKGRREGGREGEREEKRIIHCLEKVYANDHPYHQLTTPTHITS